MNFEEEEYQELVQEIQRQSPYKRKKPPKKKLMTVHEMGDLLGIKKTDRYWLVKKNVFKTKTVLGKMYVDIASFEKWYANQVKYHKVTGEEPGKELKAWTYSPQELARELGVTDGVLYDILKKENIEVVIVDYWKRVSKKSFDAWYKKQNRYRKAKDRERDAAMEAATITMPEMARLLGITRHNVYSILANEKYKHFFDFVVIAEKKRITKDSFQKFLEGQDQYRLDPRNDYTEVAMEQNAALANYRRKRLFETNKRKGNGNLTYLSRTEAAMLAKVSKTTLNRWVEKGYFPEVKFGDAVRIPREPFEDWLKQRKEMEEADNGNIEGTGR